MRSIGSALAFARNEWQHGDPVWKGRCQSFVRTCYGIGPWAPSALNAWSIIPDSEKHETDFDQIPRGAAIYFDFAPFGHAMIAGSKHAFSNDYKRRGHIDPAPRDLSRWNGKKHYLGWSLWTPQGTIGE